MTEKTKKEMNIQNGVTYIFQKILMVVVDRGGGCRRTECSVRKIIIRGKREGSLFQSVTVMVETLAPLVSVAPYARASVGGRGKKIVFYMCVWMYLMIWKGQIAQKIPFWGENRLKSENYGQI